VSEPPEEPEQDSELEPETPSGDDQTDSSSPFEPHDLESILEADLGFDVDELDYSSIDSAVKISRKPSST
jgi:hypothetical protein